MSACENIDGQCGASWCNCDEKRKEQRSLAAPSGSAERPTTIAYEMYANVRHQYDLRLAELEQAKTDRNKAAMLERRKYLPKIRRLKAENAILCDFINREMKMTAADPRVTELAARLAALPNVQSSGTREQPA